MKMTDDKVAVTGGKGHRPSTLTLVLSFLTHLLLVVPIFYIVAFALTNYSLFSWHPAAMSLGAGLIILEAIFAISGEAVLFSKVSRASRITLHWILHVVGLCLLLTGLVIIIVNKNNHGGRHFATTHSILGLVTLVFTGCVAFFGIFANNTKWLYPRVRPVVIKVLHAFAGICIAILLLTTLINGTYHYFWNGSELARSLIFASLFIGGFLVLIKPLIGAASRCRVIFGSPNKQQSRVGVAANT